MWKAQWRAQKKHCNNKKACNNWMKGAKKARTAAKLTNRDRQKGQRNRMYQWLRRNRWKAFPSPSWTKERAIRRSSLTRLLHQPKYWRIRPRMPTSKHFRSHCRWPLLMPKVKSRNSRRSRRTWSSTTVPSIWILLSLLVLKAYQTIIWAKSKKSRKT